MTRLGRITTEYRTAIRQSVSKDGCKLSLRSLSHISTVIDFDAFAKIAKFQGTISDYLILIRRSGLVAIVCELKSGGMDASKAASQLQGGSKQTEKILNGVEVTFIPLLLYGKIQHPTELKVLVSKRISFRGKKYPIKRARCGAILVEVLGTQ